MRILTLTTLYPNAAAPSHGVFVENRMRDFAATRGCTVRVVAPVPWFPVNHRAFGAYAAFAAAPAREERYGIEVRHPRYLIPPRIGMTYAASALERCFLRAAQALASEGWDFDLIDAHYLYPDGVAAVRVARRLGKPVVLTARGTDVSLIPTYARQRRMIIDAVRRADAVICVAAALKDELVRLGAPAEKISVLRNGVDLAVFRPLDREAARRALGVDGRVIASVGHLIDRKGHDVAIRALSMMPDVTLVIAGDGERRGALEALARETGVASRVRFVGRVPHEQLPVIYNAADALVLASSREGWPNVLLEAMACGTPAVASPVWGCGEVIASPAAGRIAADRSPGAVAEALTVTLREARDRNATRRYAEAFSWRETSTRLEALFRDVVARADAERGVRWRPVVRTAHRQAPSLLITVDTEEAFGWRDFDDTSHTVSRPDDIDRFQQRCEAHGAAPLYFLTCPLIADPPTVAYFADLKARGVADLGLHIHQWNTPPSEGYEGEYYSWQCNLPPAVQARKLASAAAAFRRAFGFAATAHRAGRYGVTPGAYEAIAAAGVTHDFSPSPGFDFSGRGGPDFGAMSNSPFVLETASGRRVLVTPVSGARAIRGFSRFLAQTGAPGFTATRRLIPPSVAPSLRLTCEGARLSELKSLTRRLVDDGCPILTFSLHSTTMTPGGNPYAPDSLAVDRSLDLIDAYFKWFRTDLGGEMVRLSDVERRFRADAEAGWSPVMLNPALNADN